jgi:YVTN family beta-propeller protein
VINPKKRTIVAAIDTEGTGHWAAVLPDGSKAYVANKNDRMFVTVIDLKKRKIIGHVPAPNGTEGIVASPDGKRVAVVDHVDPSLMLIDTTSDTLADRIPLEGNTKGAFKPRYTPDGSKLVVCNLSERLVNVLNTADLHGKQMVVKVGKDPMGFAVSPDGKTLLVANHGDGTVSVVDLAEGTVVKTFTAGTGIETLSYY